MKFPLTLVALLIVAWLVPFAVRAQSPPVTISQAEAVKPGVPPAPVPPSEALSWQLGLAITANEVMRRLKASPKMSWIKDGAGTINVALSVVLAVATSLGIHTEFDAVKGTFIATGLTLTSIVHFGGEFIRQYAFQQFTYQASKS